MIFFVNLRIMRIVALSILSVHVNSFSSKILILMYVDIFLKFKFHAHWIGLKCHVSLSLSDLKGSYVWIFV